MIETIQPTAWEKITVLTEVSRTDRSILFRTPSVRKVIESAIKKGGEVLFPTVVCIPGQQTLDREGNQIKLVKDPAIKDYSLLNRLDRIAWILKTVPRSKCTVILADDDWKYTFPEQYDPAQTEKHKQFLAEQIGKKVNAEQCEVTTTSDLEIKSNTNYQLVQQELLDKVLSVNAKNLPQQPGWIKSVIATAKERVSRRNAELTIADQKDLFLKAAKIQIGVVIQGLMLRSLYKENMALYLSTYKEPKDFAEEMTLMMCSQSATKPDGNFRQLPAIYCEQGNAPAVLLEKVAEAAAIKRFLLNQSNDKVI